MNQKNLNGRLTELKKLSDLNGAELKYLVALLKHRQPSYSISKNQNFKLPQQHHHPIFLNHIVFILNQTDDKSVSSLRQVR